MSEIINLEQGLHYMELLKKDGSYFQKEVRDAIDVAIILFKRQIEFEKEIKKL